MNECIVARLSSESLPLTTSCNDEPKSQTFVMERKVQSSPASRGIPPDNHGFEGRCPRSADTAFGFFTCQRQHVSDFPHDIACHETSVSEDSEPMKVVCSQRTESLWSEANMHTGSPGLSTVDDKITIIVHCPVGISVKISPSANLAQLADYLAEDVLKTGAKVADFVSMEGDTLEPWQDQLCELGLEDGVEVRVVLSTPAQPHSDPTDQTHVESSPATGGIPPDSQGFEARSLTSADTALDVFICHRTSVSEPPLKHVWSPGLTCHQTIVSEDSEPMKVEPMARRHRTQSGWSDEDEADSTHALDPMPWANQGGPPNMMSFHFPAVLPQAPQPAVPMAWLGNRKVGTYHVVRRCGDGTFNHHIFWVVDGRVLKGIAPFEKSMRALSADFVVNGSPFVMMLHPRIAYLAKGGSCFKKARGRGYIAAKCKEAVAATSLTFHLRVGAIGEEQAPRGPITNDFFQNATAFLPKDVDQWDFLSSVDPDTQNFVVALDIQGLTTDGGNEHV